MPFEIWLPLWAVSSFTYLSSRHALPRLSLLLPAVYVVLCASFTIGQAFTDKPGLTIRRIVSFVLSLLPAVLF